METSRTSSTKLNRSRPKPPTPNIRLRLPSHQATSTAALVPRQVSRNGYSSDIQMISSNQAAQVL